MLLLIVDITHAKAIHCLSTHILACYVYLSLFREPLKCDRAPTISSFMLYIKLAIVIETSLLQTSDIFFFQMHSSSVFKDFAYAGCGGD